MYSYHITSALLGLSIAGIILYLIRRDHLHTRHALWWLWIAFIILVLGIFPTTVDTLAVFLGVNYPPTLIFILGIGMLLVKVLGIDIHQSELERRQRRLTQRLAILEEENRQNAKQIKTLQQQLQSTNED